MAQTNDEQLFRKVVSKPDFRNTFSNIEKKEILDNRSAPEAWHIKELMLQIAREARLAALDDCKTLIKASQDFYDAWKGLEIIRLDADWKKVKRLNDAGEKLLAELEALRKKVE